MRPLCCSWEALGGSEKWEALGGSFFFTTPYKHKGHEPIVLARDKAEVKKKQVLEKVEEVEKEFLPRALSYLKNGVEVGEELCARAKYARSEIA